MRSGRSDGVAGANGVGAAGAAGQTGHGAAGQNGYGQGASGRDAGLRGVAVSADGSGSPASGHSAEQAVSEEIRGVHGTQDAAMRSGVVGVGGVRTGNAGGAYGSYDAPVGASYGSYRNSSRRVSSEQMAGGQPGMVGVNGRAAAYSSEQGIRGVAANMEAGQPMSRGRSGSVVGHGAAGQSGVGVAGADGVGVAGANGVGAAGAAGQAGYGAAGSESGVRGVVAVGGAAGASGHGVVGQDGATGRDGFGGSRYVGGSMAGRSGQERAGMYRETSRSDTVRGVPVGGSMEHMRGAYGAGSGSAGMRIVGSGSSEASRSENRQTVAGMAGSGRNQAPGVGSSYRNTTVRQTAAAGSPVSVRGGSGGNSYGGRAATPGMTQRSQYRPEQKRSEREEAAGGSAGVRPEDRMAEQSRNAGNSVRKVSSRNNAGPGQFGRATTQSQGSYRNETDDGFI